MQNESKNRFLQRMLSICLLLEEGTEGGGLWRSGSSEVSQWKKKKKRWRVVKLRWRNANGRSGGGLNTHRGRQYEPITTQKYQPIKAQRVGQGETVLGKNWENHRERKGQEQKAAERGSDGEEI